MEEVAKHDGALQLGGVSPEAAAMLELTRMDRLFQQFPSFESETIAVTPVPVTEETEGRPVQLPVAV
jgi:anti-anti-sigma regulatory factor